METVSNQDAPCKMACPAALDLPRLHRLIGEGKWDEARAVLRAKAPFPQTLGYVCFSPCEAKCQPAFMKQQPVAIRTLHRLVAETAAAHPALTPARLTGKRIAVVGSGPCGLTAAYYLSLGGHQVVVFESLPRPGGMMRVGIPAYRLPKEVLDKEIKEIEEAGVEIRTNQTIGSPEDLLQEGYQAAIVAIGAHKPVRMGIPGEDSAGVVDAVSFLRKVNLDQGVQVGQKVLVVGGGNSAMDAARVALRLGAGEVVVLYRRSRDEMPANPSEVEEAGREGVKMEFLAAPTKIGRTRGNLQIECVRMKLNGVDAGGRRRPEPIPESKFRIPADTVIAAVGELPDLPPGAGLALTGDHLLEVHPATLATNKKGVFAGGDAAGGPAWMIKAIADGRKAALSVDRYLGGEGRLEEALNLAKEDVQALPGTPFSLADRVSIPLRPLGERLSGFAEIEMGLLEGTGIEEAQRCLWCDLEPRVKDVNRCAICSSCQFRCSLVYKGVFNQNLAGITIAEMQPGDKKIIFNENCSGCSLCARYCSYAALELKKKVEG